LPDVEFLDSYGTKQHIFAILLRISGLPDPSPGEETGQARQDFRIMPDRSQDNPSRDLKIFASYILSNSLLINHYTMYKYVVCNM